MASGVKQTSGNRTGERADARNMNRSKLLNKKNRKWTILGAVGLGGFLLLHKGNQNATAPTQQTGPMDPLLTPGGFPPENAGGGDITGGKAPGVVTTVINAPGTVEHDCPPGWHWDAKKNRCVKDSTHGGTPPPKHKPKKNPEPRGHGRRGGNRAVKGTGGGQKVVGGGSNTRRTGGAAVHPKQASRTTPAPAGKSGRHPATARKTATGAKKRSPALVESVQGIGSGIVVAGREFPGATSHAMGAPRNIGPGMTGRIVTVNYGSHTERHVLHSDGMHWTDNPAGVNPPSRGVPTVTSRASAR